jgi:hypothetical protein
VIEQQVSPAGSSLMGARWRQPGIVLVKPDETGGVNVEHVEAAGRARGDSREGPTGLVDRTRCRSEMASGRERSFGKGTGKAWQFANHLESVASYYFQLYERPVALRIASAAILLRAVFVTSHRRSISLRPGHRGAKCRHDGVSAGNASPCCVVSQK